MAIWQMSTVEALSPVEAEVTPTPPVPDALLVLTERLREAVTFKERNSMLLSVSDANEAALQVEEFKALATMQPPKMANNAVNELRERKAIFCLMNETGNRMNGRVCKALEGSLEESLGRIYISPTISSYLLLYLQSMDSHDVVGIQVKSEAGSHLGRFP